jgi:hypothetical protein
LSLIEMEHQAIRLQRSYFANYAVLVAVIFMCVLLNVRLLVDWELCLSPDCGLVREKPFDINQALLSELYPSYPNCITWYSSVMLGLIIFLVWEIEMEWVHWGKFYPVLN